MCNKGVHLLVIRISHILWLTFASLEVALPVDTHSWMTYSSGTDTLLEWS